MSIMKYYLDCLEIQLDYFLTKLVSNIPTGLSDLLLCWFSVG